MQDLFLGESLLPWIRMQTVYPSQMFSILHENINSGYCCVTRQTPLVSQFQQGYRMEGAKFNDTFHILIKNAVKQHYILYHDTERAVDRPREYLWPTTKE